LTRLASGEALNVETLSRTDPSELVDLFVEFNRTTERLRRSHEELQGKAAELSAELAEKKEELRLKSRLATIGEMASAVAHEVRNPLGAIELYASMLESDLRHLPQQAALASKILSGVKTLESTVQNLLAFTSAPPIETKLVDLAAVVTEAYSLAIPDSGCGIELEAEFRPRPLEAKVDPNQMQCALINILQNAAQAMPDGGKLTIEGGIVGGKRRKTFIQMTDSGPGIPEEVLGRMFNPFFSTKRNGLGLGLSLAQRIVECHEGTISAVNAPPMGACFRIELPAA